MSPATFVALANTRTAENDDGNLKYYFFGYNMLVNKEPQAFALNPPANREISARFHPVDQFHLIFGKSGTSFENRETGALFVHYSDAGTFWGPFAAGVESFFCMFLRRHGTDFNGHLPEDKDRQPEGPKRSIREYLEPWLNEAYASKLPTTEPLMAPQEGGLRGYKVVIPPGVTFQGPSPAGSGGQYYVVVDGEVDYGTEELPQRSVGWVGANDEAPCLVAGAQGARLLILQFGAI